MGDPISVSAGAVVTGTAGDDIFNVLGAPTLLDGSDAYDVANVLANITFLANSIASIESFVLGSGTKVSFASLTAGYAISVAAGATKGINLSGSAGADTINGSEFGDTIDALQGNDIIYGNGGNDTLTGGPGYDQIYGGAGDDFIQVKRGTGGDLIDGGSGIDRLSIDMATRTENLILDISDPTITQYVAEGSVISGIEQITVVGGTGFDRFTGGALADSLSGGDGDDILRGNGGNDTLDGGNGYDIAVFTGKAEDYTVTDLGSGKYQVSSSLEGVDALTGIETLRFVDGDRPIGGYSSTAAYWGTPNGKGTLLSATHIPDGRGANPGTGFTITGIVRMSDGSYWAANEGQADATDTTYTPSLVHIAADGVTKLSEIVLPSSVRAVQGLAIDEATGRLFYASLSERVIRVVNYTGAQLAVYTPPVAPNALTYDASTNSLVFGPSKGASPNTTVQWLSLSTGTVTKTIDIGVNADHLFILPTKGSAGTLFVSYGEAPGTGYVAEWDIATTTKTGVFALPEADAIEGISIVGSTLYAANDAYYHGGKPPENRIELFDLSDNATQVVRSGSSTGLNIDLAGHDQTLADGTRLVGINRLFFSGGEAGDTIKAGNLDDVLVGNGGADALFGRGGNDRLVGGAGDDLLTGGAGNDRLEGAAGTDSAVFSGNFADYTFSQLSSVGVQVTDNTAGRDGSDLTSQVEFFTFKDGTFSFAELFNPPLAIGSVQLSASDIAENSVSGTLIANISMSNPENLPIVYALVDDAGGRFAISGTTLVAGGTGIDYEQQASYQVTVRATDTVHNRVVDTVFTITADNINEAPTDIQVSNLTSISELSFFALKVADIAVSDPDLVAALNTHTVTVDDSRFYVQDGALYLKAGQALSHSAEPSIMLTLTVSDDPAMLSRQVSVTVDAATVPTEVAISNASIQENLAAGTQIGVLALGPGAAGTVMYQILNDPSGLFSVNGNSLVASASLDFETGSTYSVTVRGTDQAGRQVDQQISVNVVDANEAPSSFAFNNVGYLPDHTPFATKVADLAVTDADTSAAFRNYSWQVADSRFEVIGSSLYLKAGQTINGAAGANIPVAVTLTDGAFTLTNTVSVDVKSGTDVDDKGIYAVFGTSGNDTLSGLGGNDEIYGYGGNDRLDGGAGDDIIDGGAGADNIDGGAGTDTVSYASATAGIRLDMLTPAFNTGDAAGDVLAAIENVIGSSLADRIQGNNSSNIIYGGFGADVIAGGGGTDKIYGNEGDDTLSGQGGNDLIDGGAGNDSMSGGSGGADTFVFAGGWGNDIITDYEANLDILDFKAGGISISSLTVTQIGADTWIYGPSGESLRILNTQKTAIILQAGPPVTGTVLMLDLSNSSINENSANGAVVGNLLPGTSGSSSSFSYALLDDASGRFAISNSALVATGAVMDYELATSYIVKIRLTDDQGKTLDKSFNIALNDVNDAASSVTLANQIAITENTATQTKVADIVIADQDIAAAFKSYTYSLNDSRFAVIGSSIYLQAGQVVDYEASPTIPVTLTVHDGAFDITQQFTFNVLDVNEASGPLTFNGTGADDIITTDADIINGRKGNDTITATNIYKATVSGGEGNDVITYLPGVSGGYAVLHGDDQNDTITGADGNDQLYGDGGGDIVYGLDGNDSLDGGDSDDFVYGGNGNDSILGGTGMDTLYGNAGDDTLNGGTDNDILIGGAGADTLIGGTGNDAASYVDALAGVRADLKTPANNTGDAKGDTYSEIENLIGSSYDDQLSGNDSSNTIWGGDGNDTINGLGGTDIIYGGNGNDKLNGQGGSDTINGGLGDDTISGGTSSIDLFVFDRVLNPDGTYTGWGHDTILDFEHGSDHISFKGTGLTFADLVIVQSGSNTVIADPVSGSDIILVGINASTIGAGDFGF